MYNHKNLDKEIAEINSKIKNLQTENLSEEELNLKTKQLKKQKLLLENRSNYNQRKKRTRQLIQIGALAEKIFQLDHNADIQIIEKKLIEIKKRCEA